ncbi:MAG TPA: glycine cleavage system protein GcvH [Blastocatellia bacterium]|nr:glycine cleavage system protein GcvH [Blastocatellia bacterium]
MANYPENLLYTKDHEWIQINDKQGTVGISYFAQHALGDVVYVELPKVGDKFEAGDPFGSVESVKSVNELFMPVSGEVLEINESLSDTPEAVNSDPYGDGWMIKIKVLDESEVDSLLTASEYEDFVKSQED